MRLYPWLVAPALLAGEQVLVADGGNSFNPYDLSRVAQWASREPRELLQRVHISRALTCHQMLALLRKIPEFARRREARLVLLPGFLDTSYDEAILAAYASRPNPMETVFLGMLVDLLKRLRCLQARMGEPESPTREGAWLGFCRHPRA